MVDDVTVTEDTIITAAWCCEVRNSAAAVINIVLYSRDTVVASLLQYVLRVSGHDT